MKKSYFFQQFLNVIINLGSLWQKLQGGFKRENYFLFPNMDKRMISTIFYLPLEWLISAFQASFFSIFLSWASIHISARIQVNFFHFLKTQLKPCSLFTFWANPKKLDQQTRTIINTYRRN